MNFEHILLSVADDIAVLTLNEPDSRNGLTAAMQGEILAALEQLHGRRDARALILTGTGKSFCAGADLGQLLAGGSKLSVGQATARLIEEVSNPLICALQELPMPVVCAVNGSAAGAGISLALAADIVVAARSSFFLAPFLPRLGIVPDLGATWFLPQHIGRARALGMMLLGDRLPAEKAQEWGLIWACVDDRELMTEARRLAVQLAKTPAHSALEARRALAAAERNSLAEQLDFEKNRQQELLDLPSFSEGVTAFFEKRDPHFKS